MSSALDVLEGLEDDSGDDEEAMTAADVLQKLEEVKYDDHYKHFLSSKYFIPKILFCLRTSNRK